MTALQVHIAHKRYATGAVVLQDLSFAARSGEFVALVGPSGAGKTTLLHILSGLDPAFAGTVDTDPTSRTGFVFQEPRLLPWLTVAQNLRLVHPGLDEAGLQAALNSTGLEACGARYPGQLSGGMQRRVGLLRAFLGQPGLLLLDEPFQSLDAPTAQQLRQLLMTLRQQSQPTVVFVTHSMAEALALADRVLFLCKAPCRVVLDYPVPPHRSPDPDAPQVQALQQALLQQYPDILKGVANA